MGDTSPIPAPSDEQLEILTQIRIGRSWRVHARRAIIRRARSIRSQSRVIPNEFVVTGRRPYPRLFWELRQLLEALVRNMEILRVEEQAMREVEEGIWMDVLSAQTEQRGRLGLYLRLAEGLRIHMCKVHQLLTRGP